MMVAAKLTGLTADSVLLSYGSGVDGATPNLMVDSVDHLAAGFQGSGWTADIGSAIGSRKWFFRRNDALSAPGEEVWTLYSLTSRPSAVAHNRCGCRTTNQQLRKIDV